ncbi:Phosphoribosylglycinamide formyltransferase [Zancudomyces culisetae]|uniref:phosphoribosylglycinamide formyltransferase 1 n=1 Tax=Zancudomyces culisetae TaxID=1213189 RepID=A0A1R1PT16_ZANCU|nr:Phosphoribosylglycinamide formyltransferase [Zancudomyces culisetae]|eukprot:OMH84108.1 Phosphoribosylglycinamide formyltransferase [Zancudomyces culisetae]
MISGNGSNLQAIIDFIKGGEVDAEIVRVISNKSNAYGLERAKNAGIPTHVQTLKSFKDRGLDREAFNKELAQYVADLNPDLIVLAGWMLILSESFVNRFVNKIINLHPSLPGDIVGANAIDNAYAEFKAGNRTKTGVMVHYVIPAVDEGKPILAREVPILPEDSIEDLENRIHQAEHQLLPLAIKQLLG